MSSLSVKLRYGFLRSPLRHVLKTARGMSQPRIMEARRKLAVGVVDDQCSALGADLNRNGYVILDTMSSRDLLDAMACAAQARLEERLPAGPTAGHVTAKAFWTRLVDAELIDGRFPADSPFVRFAVQPGILGVISAALGSVPLLDYVLLTQSHFTAEPLAHSQLWHRDYDDTRTIKVFVYLSDVQERSDGPFTFIPGPQSDKVGITLKSHLTDAEAFRRILGAKPKEMIAPRLSVFAVETSRCLHMGSRLGPDRSRLLYTATFTSFPKILGEHSDRFALSGNESELERAVLAPVAWAAGL